MIGVSLEGDALSWFQWVEKQDPFHDWHDLHQQPVDQFSSINEGTLCSQLLNIQQIRSIKDYRRDFEQLSRVVEDLFEDILEEILIKGLKPDIQAEVRLLEPRGIKVIMKIAKQVEEQNSTIHSKPPQNLFSSTLPPLPIGGHSSIGITHPLEVIEASRKTPTNHQCITLSDSKFQARKPRGLCYSCDKRYSPRHVCKKGLQLLVLKEVTGIPKDDQVISSSLEMPDQERIPMDQVDLSLSLIMEFTKLDTLKLQGKLREQNVIVLIDSGATHNFIWKLQFNNSDSPLPLHKNTVLYLAMVCPYQEMGSMRGFKLNSKVSPYVMTFSPFL